MLLLAIGNQRIIVAALAGNTNAASSQTLVACIAAIVTLTAADRYTSAATDFLQTKVNPPLRNLVHVLD